MLPIKALVDLLVIDEPHAPCIFVPSEYWEEFCAAIEQQPNLVGAVIYRNRTIRDGGPYTELRTRR